MKNHLKSIHKVNMFVGLYALIHFPFFLKNGKFLWTVP